jgi:peptidoglycan L-alanyl-D-glutamate endopeptidase CwlK
VSFKFGQRSLENLSQAHPKLQELFHEVIKIVDCSVICGFRNEKAQMEAFRTGASRKKWPQSMHNKLPSLAVDVVPHPLDWKDYKRFFYLAGIVKAVAFQKQIPIRWGGDWNQNQIFTDERFSDLPHFELILNPNQGGGD